MKAARPLANGLFALLMLITVGAAPVCAEASRLDDLFQQLQTATDEEAGPITASIWLEWSKSGSAAMDLLLRRGQDALAEGDPRSAVEHLTALIDHAPDFAEGYNERATAYYQMGQMGPAVADIARTLALNPRHFGALSGLGMIFEQLNAPDKALEVYKEALKLNPHMTDVQKAVDRLNARLGGQEL